MKAEERGSLETCGRESDPWLLAYPDICSEWDTLPMTLKCLPLQSTRRASLVAQTVKNLPANAGDRGSIPVLEGSPGEAKWQPTPVFLPGESRGQRSLVGYSPWGHS